MLSSELEPEDLRFTQLNLERKFEEEKQATLP